MATLVVNKFAADAQYEALDFYRLPRPFEQRSSSPHPLYLLDLNDSPQKIGRVSWQHRARLRWKKLSLDWIRLITIRIIPSLTVDTHRAGASLKLTDTYLYGRTVLPHVISYSDGGHYL